MSTTAAISLLRPAEAARQLREELLARIVPFWTRHAIDPAGGINTCIGDDGKLISRDKWAWSQWRAVWTFSELYRTIEPQPEWLEIARGIYRFCVAHGWDRQHGGWHTALDGQGRPLPGTQTIYSDGFAIAGCLALARAGGEAEPIATARRSAEHVLRLLEQPHDRIPHFPYPVPTGARVHGIPMIFSLVFWELGQYLDDQRYRSAALRLSDEVFEKFYRPSRDLVLERIGSDGAELPPPLGTAVVPGHVIEDMWFQIHIARDRGDAARLAEAVRLIRRHLEVGWDGQFGGLFLAIDADGREDVAWEFADTKLWWPQTEALYALALAHEHSGEAWCAAWFERLWEYCRTHYPVAEHGEWRQKLDREGRPLARVIALPVKDPFHLPRALMYTIASLQRVAAKESPR